MPLLPPRDATGVVMPHDDPEIGNETILVRHINPAYHVVLDENIGGRRISSNAFSCSTGDPGHGMSVDIGQLLSEAARSMAAMVPMGFGAVSLNVGQVRNLVLKVGSDPIPEKNPYHGQTWGVRRRARPQLHGIVIDWVVAIEGVAIR